MAGIESALAKSSGFDMVLGGVGSAASGASALTGLLDSIFGWSSKRQYKNAVKLMDKQYDQQMSFYERQLADQLAQWNRENEYNDPTNAYKRLVNGLERNGLNKALAIGGAASGVTASSGHNASVPSGGSTGLPQSTLLPMGSVQSLANLRQRAEIANIDANTQKIKREAGLVDVQTTNEMLRSSILDAQHTLMSLQAKNVKADTALKNATESLIKLQSQRYDELTDSQIKSNLSNVVTSLSHYIDSVTKRNLSVAQRSQALAAARMYVSTAVLNAARALTERALTEKYGAETAREKLNNQMFAMNFSHIADKIVAEAELKEIDVVRAKKENWWLNVDKVTQNVENLSKAFYYICTGAAAGDDSVLGDVPSFINGMNADEAIGAASGVF
jgi:hypothetical protein